MYFFASHSVIELDNDKPNSTAHEGQNYVQDKFIDELENPTSIDSFTSGVEDEIMDKIENLAPIHSSTSGSASGSTPQDCITEHETKPEQAIESSDYNTERYKVKCELCDFVHRGGNKGFIKRTRENHLLTDHFMEKISELFPPYIPGTYICTLEEKCNFQTHQKYGLTQHYINKHKILEKYVSEALERKNL